MEAYEAFSKNEQSIEDLWKQVEQDCGIRFTEDEIAEEKKIIVTDASIER
ncbi:hypothetical protein [Blautia pseudococcoides]|nr:hypothetical protein [Blautia pseudococcoides]MCR2019379.1 hypothetical protein [Blautia pseudococcoides]QJU13995.1 hypothetical protein HL650_05705 [Blautia pseudococcoides]QQQ93399.1 hypothetical protein I5Q86_00845 [Blautia pseudococcoides]